MRSFILLLFIILLYSCSNRDKVPKHILSIKQMYPVMWDLARADVMVTYTHRDTTERKQRLDSLYSQVFVIHDITSEKFRESLNFYEQNPEILKVLMDSLRSYERRVLNDPAQREMPTENIFKKGMDSMVRSVKE